MADKSLTETGWKAFSKGKSYKDAPFLQALAQLDKAEKGGPQKVIEALDGLDKQLDALKKAHKGDKSLEKYLDEVGEAADKLRRTSEKEAREAQKEAEKKEKAAREQAEAEEEEDEDEAPDLLTGKLVPLLKLVRKGETVNALVGVIGNDAAALLSRKPIPAGRVKLIREYLGGGTVKFMRGQCLLEANAHTFVLDGAAGGMAKKLKAGLFKQTEMRRKVRVRGSDPNDVDEDLVELGGDVQGGVDAQALKAEFERVKKALYPRLSAAVRDNVPQREQLVELMGKADREAQNLQWMEALALYGQLEDLLPEVPPPAPPEKPTPDPAAEWRRRSGETEPRMLEALKSPQADAGRIRAVWGFAQQKATAGDYAAAVKSLDTLDKLIGGGGGSTAPSGPPTGSTGDAGALEAAVEVWRARRNTAVATLRTLAKEIADAKLPEADKAIIEVSAVFKQLGGEPRTVQQVSDMERWLGEDDVVADVCDIEEDIRTPLLEALQGVRQALAGAG